MYIRTYVLMIVLDTSNENVLCIHWDKTEKEFSAAVNELLCKLDIHRFLRVFFGLNLLAD